MRTKQKCYCFTCWKAIDSLGIARHRSMHRDKKEYCEIRYSRGNIIKHFFNG